MHQPSCWRLCLSAQRCQRALRGRGGHHRSFD
jgi:hypothetical protein